MDYEAARTFLLDRFHAAEEAVRIGQIPKVTHDVAAAVDALFLSATQSYREVLLGCALTRLIDPTANIRLPYASHGPTAFNGRSLDEKVVNQVLQDRLVPSSKGPYLATFRRAVKFVPETAEGLRDKVGYFALLTCIEAFEVADESATELLLSYLLCQFVQLRNRANIPLSRISRLSLEQHQQVVKGMLRVASGGLVPVILTVAMLQTIKQCFNLNWEIETQGINVSDASNGAGGDVTVTQGGEVVLAIEVTERPIDRARVVTTFNTKIVRAGIADYLFVYSNALPAEDARQAARTYFTQGHEINFLQIEQWLASNLATLGSRCRATFTHEVVAHLSAREISATVKLAWNDVVREVVGA